MAAMPLNRQPLAYLKRHDGLYFLIIECIATGKSSQEISLFPFVHSDSRSAAW